MSDIDLNDTQSQSSTVSLSRMMLECPECKKELQARSMFKHMRLYHASYLDRCVCLYKFEDFDELIEDGKAYPFDWEITNDFDEKETKSIWGCLGCNATFTSAITGNKHCQGKCKKEHIKGIKEYKKEFIKATEATKKKSEQEKKIPSYSNEKWIKMIEDALLTHKYYYNNLTKLINKIKEQGDDKLFIDRTVRICSSLGHWRWKEIEMFSLPKLQLTGDELASEYAKVCFGITHMASQLRVLFDGIERQFISNTYGWDWLDNIMLHPPKSWQQFCEAWMWIHFKHFDTY